MAALKKEDSQLADSKDFPLIGAAQSAITLLTIVYGTDDPGPTLDSEINIADGDAVLVNTEVLLAIEELAGKVNEVLEVLVAHGLSKAP